MAQDEGGSYRVLVLGSCSQGNDKVLEAGRAQADGKRPDLTLVDGVPDRPCNGMPEHAEGAFEGAIVGGSDKTSFKLLSETLGAVKHLAR